MYTRIVDSCDTLGNDRAIVLMQVAGVLFLSQGVIVAIGGIFLALDVALVWFGARLFRHEELLLGSA